ncbi:TPA: molecular chaperone [Providencia alcalifaciens]|nr:molecular chaperone [Providencia alcalifaciens]
MTTLNTLLWGGIAALLSITAQANMPEEGISMQGTRLIYSAKSKNGVTFNVTNNSSQVYLLQSRVLPWRAQNTEPAIMQNPDKKLTPFMVLPPLVRFSENETITLRIRLTENHLPVDRESAFTLALKAIPGQPAPKIAKGEGAKMVLALQNNLKMFYRPEGLPQMDANLRAKKLQFTYRDGQLEINNPTPYYATFGELSIDGRAISQSSIPMIAPYSHVHHPIKTTGKAEIRWKIIDDLGRKTAEQTQRLNDTH